MEADDLMYVDAGELKHKIEIFRREPNRDSSGYGKSDEIPVRSCRAKVTQVSGTEMVKANADFGEVKTRFLVRYTRTKLDRKMFVRYQGNDYEILYINPYGDSREFLEIWCKWTGRGGGP